MSWRSIASPLVTRVFLLALPVMLVTKAVQFARSIPGPDRELTDFNVFYVAGRLAWRGDMAAAYRFATMGPAEVQLGGAPSFMPWTYPPPFDLIVGMLARLPESVAYLVFVGATLAAFLVILRRLAGGSFPFVLLAFYPALMINLFCGQNGLLTGSLVGLLCLGLRRGGPAAGLPLGAMVIKPHLAVALALHALAAGRWACLGGAMLMAGLLSGGATLVFGAAIWPAFLHGLSEAGTFLAAGAYPLFRMVSAYAVLRSLDAPPALAALAQGLVACAALGFVVWIARAGCPAGETLGLTALMSLLVSPYAYDYDLPIAGVGLALLAPELLRRAAPREQIAILVAAMALSGFGLAMTLALKAVPGDGPRLVGSGIPAGDFGVPALGGLMFLGWIGLIVQVLLRRAPQGLARGAALPRIAPEAALAQSRGDAAPARR